MQVGLCIKMGKKGKKANEEQKMFLATFMEENMDFAHDRFGGHQMHNKWQELAAILNSIGGAFKEPNQWRKFWTDQKLRVKEREALLKASFQRSGKNGSRMMKELSSFESRVLSMFSEEPNQGNVLFSIEEETPMCDLEMKKFDVFKKINTSTQVEPSTSARASVDVPSATSSEEQTCSSPTRKQQRALSEDTTHSSSFEGKMLEVEEGKLIYIKKNYVLKKKKMKWRKEYEIKRLLLRERELNLREKQLDLKIKNNNII